MIRTLLPCHRIPTIAIVLTYWLSGCAGYAPTRPPLAEQLQEIQVEDPYEGFNRAMYYFNAKADMWVVLPTTQAYETITPDVVETGISNFFDNLLLVPTFANQLLQLKPQGAAETLMRFAVNTGFGIGGIVDVASAADIPRHQEDFGQTLGFWGIAEGPYLILPLLGPSNLRDAGGLAVDNIYALNPTYLLSDPSWTEQAGVTGLRGIDARSDIDLEYYQSGSPFEYNLLRLLYTQKRRFDIAR